MKRIKRAFGRFLCKLGIHKPQPFIDQTRGDGRWITTHRGVECARCRKVLVIATMPPPEHFNCRCILKNPTPTGEGNKSSGGKG